MGCLRREGPLLERLKRTPVQIVEVDLRQGVDSPSGLLRILKLARFLRKQRFEIMHAYSLWSNMVGMAAAMLAQTPVTITSQRDLSLAAWYGTYRRRVLRFVQRSWDPQALAAALMRAHRFRCEDTTPTWFRKTKGRC